MISVPFSRQEIKCTLKNCSLLYVETADRPGLLVDLVKTITDINVAVQSGEFDTEVTSPNSLYICTVVIVFTHLI